jgi:hypothetical protein
MPALKASSASLSAAMQLLLSCIPPPPLETADGEVATVVGASAARREKRSRRNIAAAVPWKEDRGVAAIVFVLTVLDDKYSISNSNVHMGVRYWIGHFLLLLASQLSFNT